MTAHRFNFIKAAWKKVLELTGLNIRIHDLRRTLGSWQAATGASLPIIGPTLNHKHPSTTEIYARLDVDPIREAMEITNQAILNAGKRVSPQSNNLRRIK